VSGGAAEGPGGQKSLYCARHGWNSTHGTDQCFVIKKEVAAGGLDGAPQTGSRSTNSKQFSRRSFRKEVNLMASAKGSNKRKVLELYESAVKAEKAKLKAVPKKAKKKSTPASDSTDSDSDKSVEVIEQVPPAGNERAAMKARLKAAIQRANLQNVRAIRKRTDRARVQPVEWSEVDLSGEEEPDNEAADSLPAPSAAVLEEIQKDGPEAEEEQTFQERIQRKKNRPFKSASKR